MIDLGPRAEAFRLEVREWLEENRPTEDYDFDLENFIFQDYSELEDWAKRVGDAGFMCITWPTEYGGRGLSERELVVLNEEFARVGVPRPNRGLGETLVAPALFAWGTDAQKSNFLPRIADGSDRYCQGFSEPDAGSDLASLRAEAEIDGEHLVVSGQKVWTSGALTANMAFCLVRSDRTQERHRGLSYVLIPMHLADGRSNGMEVRPLRQPTGACHFAELFLDGARAPLDNVIGGLGNGWKVAQTTLGSERGGLSTQHAPFLQQFWDAVDIARKRGLVDDPHIRQRLAAAYASVQLIRFSGLRQLAASLVDQEPPIPDALIKLFWSEHSFDFAQSIMNLRGPESLILREGDGADYDPDVLVRAFLSSPGFRIAGGSNEILRNIVAERSLGLPR